VYEIPSVDVAVISLNAAALGATEQATPRGCNHKSNSLPGSLTLQGIILLRKVISTVDLERNSGITSTAYTPPTESLLNTLPSLTSLCG
jgi:hypothetical protein